jgi:hypothetical protein
MVCAVWVSLRAAFKIPSPHSPLNPAYSAFQL